jgi:hypothetical protein
MAFYGFLLAVGAIGIFAYVTLYFRFVPGFAEQRLGRLEDLPPDVGKWKVDESSPVTELIRETRYWWDSDAEKLFLQVRYRARDTREIVGSEPDKVIKRRRIK